MILTLIRTDKKNKKHLKRQQVESMLPIVSDKSYDDTIRVLRDFVSFPRRMLSFRTCTGYLWSIPLWL